MPNTFISASIATGLTIEAGHVTQSADAFTGTEAYDITISGSLTNTGSLDVSGSVGISGNTTIGGTLTAANATINNAVLSGSTDITGSIVVTGSLTVSGSGTFNNIGPFNQTGDSGFIGTHRMSSSASPSIVSVLTENDSFPFIQGATTTGPNFRMNLADANASGSAYMAFGRQTGVFGGTGFSTAYTTGSNASQGEIIMTLGKNGPVGQIFDRFIVQSEPGPIATNTTSELTLSVGSSTFSRRIVQGLVQNGTNDSAEFVAGNQDATPGYKKHVLMAFTFNNTSSVAGFASSSLNTGSTARNFNANSIPFGIVAGGLSTAELEDTVFFVDRGGSLGSILPVTASFEISRGGSINMEGHITASGNISGSSTTTLSVGGDITGGGRGTFTNRVSALTDLVTPKILNNTSANNGTVLIDDGLTISGNVTASANISASGDITGNTGSFQHIDLPDGAAIKSLPGGNVEIISEDGAFLQITDSFIFNNNGATFAVNAQGDVSDIRHITASGNISSSKFIGGGLEIEGASSIKIDSGTSGMEIFGNQIEMGGRDESKLLIINGLNASGTGRLFIGDSESDFNGAHLDIQVGGASAHFNGLNVTGSKHGLFQAGKPIVTHTSSPISSSLANAGKYHIVGGTLTASIVLDSNAPVGAEYEFFQSSSTGQFLFESASGTTVISKNGSIRLAQQGSSAVLKKVSTTTFHLMGDLT